MTYATASLHFVGPSILLLGSLAGSGCQAARVTAAAHPQAEDEVNVGYGMARKQDVGGAVSTLLEKDLASDRSGGIEEFLRSRLPGVQVVRSASGEISLSIRGRNPPLVLLDGVPLRPGDLDRINPHDVERIDVLRDLASSAIYGTRGGNGVVLIITKRPR